MVAPKTAQQIYLHDHLQRMHNEIEATTRKLELEKRRLNKLDDDVARMRVEHDEKVVKQQSKAINLTSVRKMESRLAKAISQLNELGHDNEEKRAKINAIRRDRIQLQSVFKKLQFDIRDNISSVTQLQRETDAHRREQDERQHRMAGLKKQLEIERKNFKSKVQELQQELKHREREELLQRVATVRGHDDNGGDDVKKGRVKCLKADEEDNFNSPAVMRRILKLAFLNAIQRRHIRQHQKNIEVFEQAFATIKSTTGISDIEEIVKIFVALEQRNYSLLTYVNTLNREIEQFEKHNRELEEQINSQRRGEAEGEKLRTEKLSDLIKEVQKTQAAIEENQVQVKEQHENFEKCRPLVFQLMRIVEKENKGFGGAPAPEFGGEGVLAWLTFLEKTLTQWRDFLPDTKATRHYKTTNKNYKYTVGNQVLSLQPKRHAQPAALVRPGDLPSANIAEQGAQARGAALVRTDEDSETDEEELQNHPWSRQELRDKAIASVAKRKKHRKVEAPSGQQGGQGPSGLDATRDEAAAGAIAAVSEGVTGQAGEMNYEELVEKSQEQEEESNASDGSDAEDDAGPTDEEIDEIFLKRYKMSKEELQSMADKMGIQLNNLCYLKQEFDAYDEDRSGYIDVKELKGLLEKLGEELTDDELDQAFRELDQDGSGEIEFFEFVEWFTSED